MTRAVFEVEVGRSLTWAIDPACQGQHASSLVITAGQVGPHQHPTVVVRFPSCQGQQLALFLQQLHAGTEFV